MNREMNQTETEFLKELKILLDKFNMEIDVVFSDRGIETIDFDGFVLGQDNVNIRIKDTRVSVTHIDKLLK